MNESTQNVIENGSMGLRSFRCLLFLRGLIYHIDSTRTQKQSGRMQLTSSLAWPKMCNDVAQKQLRQRPFVVFGSCLLAFVCRYQSPVFGCACRCLAIFHRWIPMADDDSGGGGGNPLASEAPGGRRWESVGDVLKEPRIRCRRRRGIYLGPASATAAGGARRYRYWYSCRIQDQQDQQGSSQGLYY